MDRMEWLILQVIFLTIVLIAVLGLLFIIRYEKSRWILTIVNLLSHKIHTKKKTKNIETVKARLYIRNASERTNIIVSIFFLILVAFIVLNHYVSFVVVTSDSMATTFEKGDLVLMQSINRIPQEREIIQFNVPSRKLPVVHRVNEITPSGNYITKGDFNPYPDDWIIKASQVQAKTIILFGKPVIIPKIGDLFIVESRFTRFGTSAFSFAAGVINIFKLLALIIFILAVLSLFETLLGLNSRH
jgi:signal peptidase I